MLATFFHREVNSRDIRQNIHLRCKAWSTEFTYFDNNQLLSICMLLVRSTMKTSQYESVCDCLPCMLRGTKKQKKEQRGINSGPMKIHEY